MLAMTGGRERTKAEFRALLDAADYKLTRIIPTMAPQRVLEAVPKIDKTGIRFTQVAAICSMAVPKLDSRDHNM
jgi:hypothetical protein